MKIPTIILLLPVMIIFLFAGCSDQSNPLGSNLTNPQDIIAPRLSIPSDAKMTSASIVFNIASGGNQITTLHRITSDWSESEVTWGNFDGAFEADPTATFTPTALGDVSVDVSELATQWLNGSTPNYGVVVRQAVQLSQYNSSEASNLNLRPRLIIRYMTNDGPDSTVVQEGVNGLVEDAFIGSSFPTGNNGEAPRLFVGVAFGTEHQTLIKFQMGIAQQQLGSLGDLVWEDINRNSVWDADEPGLAGVVVNLCDARLNPIVSAVTDSNGFYLFDELAAGDYLLEFVTPAGYAISTSNLVDGRSGTINLSEGQNDLSWDVGMFIPGIISDTEACTHGLGYWKNHIGFGPQANNVSGYLPIWLGSPGGSKSIQVRTAEILYDILRMQEYGHPSNGITKLYAQLLVVKLNISRGTDQTDVVGLIGPVDDFLAGNDWTDWRKLSKDEQKMIREWANKLSDYNSGITGPGSCDNYQDDIRINQEK